MANIRWKLITIAVVFVVFAGVGVYPIVAARYGVHSPAWLMDRQLKLGLDLNGGVQLVLRVQTDDVLKLATDTEMERLRAELAKANITFTTLASPDPTRFRVEGIQTSQDAAFRQASNEVQANFERASAGPGAYVFTMRPNIVVQLRAESVVQARQTIERRVNELGVTEPSIAQQGDDQLSVQLPGVTDVDRAKGIIGSPGLLELKIVEQGPASTAESLQVNGQVPAGMEIVPGATVAGDASSTSFYLVRRVAAVTGRDIRTARSSLDENNQPAVSFTFGTEGGRKFGNVTGENIGRQLAIILDGRVQSAPRIDSRITTDGRITGSFTQEEVSNLSLILRSGALPASLTYLEERTIGPSLGADSIRAGVMASIVGLGLVVLFMLMFYKLSGINAIVAMTVNLLVLLALMVYFHATMTLPGIAGFILTIGMCVDSNVLIFERIKEELLASKGVRAAVQAGFDRVFWTIFDTHVASLIAAAVLFQFGTGPIRGFATTLTIGLLTNVFTSVFVSRALFELALGRGRATRLSI